MADTRRVHRSKPSKSENFSEYPEVSIHKSTSSSSKQRNSNTDSARKISKDLSKQLKSRQAHRSRSVSRSRSRSNNSNVPLTPRSWSRSRTRSLSSGSRQNESKKSTKASKSGKSNKKSSVKHDTREVILKEVKVSSKSSSSKSDKAKKLEKGSDKIESRSDRKSGTGKGEVAKEKSSSSKTTSSTRHRSESAGKEPARGSSNAKYKDSKTSLKKSQNGIEPSKSSSSKKQSKTKPATSRSRSFSRSPAHNTSYPYLDDDYYPTRSRTRSRSVSRSRSRNSASLSPDHRASKRAPASPSYSKSRRGFESKSSRGGYQSQSRRPGEEEDSYEHGQSYPSRYPGGRGAGYRGELPPGGGYPPHGSNRNTFYPGHGGIRPPYHNPNYLGKPKNNRYYQHQMQMGQMPDMGGYGDGPDGYDGPGGAYHMGGRFNPGYRFNPKFGSGPEHYGQGGPGYGYKQQGAQSGAKGRDGNALSPGGEGQSAETIMPQIEPLPPVVIDAELVAEVNSITSQMAAATAAGKEMVLTQTQQLTLQKHQLLVQQQQIQQQQQQQQIQNNALLAKKFPNYRLLGRNIFEGKPVNQPFIKKRVKVNTYYSRFIKQHPTNNLPLAFQKSINLGENQAPDTNQPTKTATIKKSSKKKKKESESSSNSDSESGSSHSSGSSRSSSSDSNSETSSSTDGEIKKSGLKKKQTRKEKLRLKKQAGSSSSSGSESSISSTGEISEKKSAKKKKITKGKISAAKNRQGKKQSQQSHHQKMHLQANGVGDGYDSDGSMLDLREDLKPIGKYIRDRERMLDEMLRCIKGQKLQSMLPDILKNKSLEEIRARCLDELDIMSKKRIMCLLNDEKMLSSSGTEEESTDDHSETENLDSKRIKGENLKNFNQKQTASKFKPLGVETIEQTKSPKAGSAITPPLTREENGDHYTASPGQEQHTGETLEGKKSSSGIAAAGFKTFVGKKPISIKIASVDNESNISEETRILKENKHISKKRSNTNFGDLKIKPDSGDDGIQQQTQNEHQGINSLQSFPSTNNNNAPIMPIHMSESEKLRIQINQYNIANPNQQHHPHLQQQYNMSRFQQPSGHHLRPNQQPGLLQPPYAIPVIPPPTFAIPPPNMGGQRLLPGQQIRQPYNLPPPQQFQQPPPGFMNMPFNSNPNQLPPHLYNQQNPQQFQQMQQHMLGIQGNLPGLQNKLHKYDDEIDNLNVNDDAYDLDEEDLLLTGADQNDLVETTTLDKKEKYRGHRTGRRSKDDEVKRGSKSKGHKSHANSRGKQKRKHSSDSNFSDDYDEEGAESSGDHQDLEGIKEMLISILTIHIDNDQDYDEDLKSTLQSLLTQITEDDGSLSFEELSQLHSTIKSLTEENEESAASSEDKSNSEDSEDERRRRRKKSDHKASKEDLRRSRKKRRYAGERGKGGKRRHKSNNRDYDDEDSSLERSRIDDANEVEAGEIDDVCEEEFAVEKEFEDLLSYNNSNNSGMMVGNGGNSANIGNSGNNGNIGHTYHRHGNPNLQQQQMMLQQQQQQLMILQQQQQQMFQQNHIGMNYNGNTMGGGNSYPSYNHNYGGNQHSMINKNGGHQGNKNNNPGGIY